MTIADVVAKIEAAVAALPPEVAADLKAAVADLAPAVKAEINTAIEATTKGIPFVGSLIAKAAETFVDEAIDAGLDGLR